MSSSRERLKATLNASGAGLNPYRALAPEWSRETPNPVRRQPDRSRLGARPRAGKPGRGPAADRTASGFPHCGQTWSRNIVGSPPVLGRLTAEGKKELVDLVLEVAGIGKCPGDFVLERRTKSLPEPVDGDFHGPARHSQFRAELGIRRRVAFAHQGGLQALEEQTLVLAVDFALEPVEHASEQRQQRPPPIEQSLGCLLVSGLSEVTALGVTKIKRQMGNLPPA